MAFMDRLTNYLGPIVVFWIFLPCLTKSFMETSFSQNFASEVTFVRLARSIGYLQELLLLQELYISI